ncbi:hypothetical protein BDW71DRAFT_201898 [Aspergillus fruticulosus]
MEELNTISLEDAPNFKSKNNQILLNTQITQLITLTRQWTYDRTPDTLSIWASDPSNEWIQECLRTKLPNFEDCDENTENNEKLSARRRVLLMVLHDIIQREKLRLQTSRQAQSVKFLTTAIKNIVGQAYPGRNDTEKELVLAPLQNTSSKLVCPS